MAGVSLATGVTATDLTSPVSIDTLTVTTLTVLGKVTLQGSLPELASYIIGPSSTNVCGIIIDILDGNSGRISEALPINFYLSDSPVGGNLAVHTPSGGVSAITGAIFYSSVANLYMHAVTDATGALQIHITDTAKTGYYVCVEVNGHILATRQLTSADYGA